MLSPGNGHALSCVMSPLIPARVKWLCEHIACHKCQQQIVFDGQLVSARCKHDASALQSHARKFLSSREDGISGAECNMLVITMHSWSPLQCTLPYAAGAVPVAASCIGCSPLSKFTA